MANPILPFIQRIQENLHELYPIFPSQRGVISSTNEKTQGINLQKVWNMKLEWNLWIYPTIARATQRFH